MTRCKGAAGRKHHFLSAAALGVKDDVVHFVPFAVDLVVVVEGLHAGVAAIGVVVKRVLKFAFLGGKLLDDLLGRRWGRGDVHVAEAGVERHGRRSCPCSGRSTARAHPQAASKTSDRPQIQLKSALQIGYTPCGRRHRTCEGKGESRPLLHSAATLDAWTGLREDLKIKRRENGLKRSQRVFGGRGAFHSRASYRSFASTSQANSPFLFNGRAGFHAGLLSYSRARAQRLVPARLRVSLSAFSRRAHAAVVSGISCLPWSQWPRSTWKALEFCAECHPWLMAPGQSAMQISSALFFASLSPGRFRLGRLDSLCHSVRDSVGDCAGSLLWICTAWRPPSRGS